MSDQITMAKAKGVSRIPMSSLISVIYKQSGQLVSQVALNELIESLPFDVTIDQGYITLANEQDGLEEPEESDIEGPAIDAANKEMKK